MENLYTQTKTLDLLKEADALLKANGFSMYGRSLKEKAFVEQRAQNRFERMFLTTGMRGASRRKVK